MTKLWSFSLCTSSSSTAGKHEY